MKVLNWISWGTGIVAALFMLFGGINFLFDTNFLGVNHAINFFHMANSFLLLTICIQLVIKTCKKED